VNDARLAEVMKNLTGRAELPGDLVRVEDGVTRDELRRALTDLANLRRADRNLRIMGKAVRITVVSDLCTALRESIALQAHYAALLNMHDGGERVIFHTVDEWETRLREIGKL